MPVMDAPDFSKGQFVVEEGTSASQDWAREVVVQWTRPTETSVEHVDCRSACLLE